MHGPMNVKKNYLRLVCLSVRHSAWNNSAATGWIFIKYDFFREMKLEDSERR